MQWLQAGNTADEIVTAINYRSGLCLPEGASTDARMGEILFRSPSLFGGQAAKARLTCQSCHVDGGDNPFFHFPNISGAPGTADVSNSFFNAAGSNATFDPVPIPDLSKPGKISRTDPAVLEAFLETLIVIEFSGQAPSEAIIASLAAYTREIGPCDAAQQAEHSALDEHIAIAGYAVNFAKRRYDHGDHETAKVLIAAARDTYGLIYERFAGEQHHQLQTEIADLSAQLGPLQSHVDADIWQSKYTEWRAASLVLVQSLRRAEQESYYDDVLLRSALQ